MAFYGDGSNVREMYGRGGETYDEAAAKFHASDSFVPQGDKNAVPLSYEEARRVAYGP